MYFASMAVKSEVARVGHIARGVSDRRAAEPSGSGAPPPILGQSSPEVHDCQASYRHNCNLL